MAWWCSARWFASPGPKAEQAEKRSSMHCACFPRLEGWIGPPAHYPASMRNLGMLLLLLGAGSAVLHFMEREFRLLAWIDTWGDTAAWGIRGGLIVVGLLLVLAGKGGDKKK